MLIFLSELKIYHIPFFIIILVVGFRHDPAVCKTSSVNLAPAGLLESQSSFRRSRVRFPSWDTDFFVLPRSWQTDLSDRWQFNHRHKLFSNYFILSLHTGTINEIRAILDLAPLKNTLVFLDFLINEWLNIIVLDFPRSMIFCIITEIMYLIVWRRHSLKHNTIFSLAFPGATFLILERSAVLSFFIFRAWSDKGCLLS